MNEITAQIKDLRKKRQMSQAYVAGKLGMSRPTYIRIESGKQELTYSELKKLAEVFEVAVESFFQNQPDRVMEVSLEDKVEQPLEKQERISVPRNQVDKFKEVLLYVLEKMGAKAHVGETVIYKLLYFIDFDYYEKYEEQLVGALYRKNHHGPTPVAFQKIVQEMQENEEIETVKSKYFQYEQKKYLPRRAANLQKLTAQEIKHIDEVLARLGEMNATDLSAYSHQDVPWITAQEGKTMDYEAVFYRTEKTSVRTYEPENN